MKVFFDQVGQAGHFVPFTQIFKFVKRIYDSDTGTFFLGHSA